MYFLNRFLCMKMWGTKGGIFVWEWGGMLLCLNTILRIYWMYRMVLHPVHRFILKIVFKMGGRVCGVGSSKGLFLCGLAALREN